LNVIEKGLQLPAAHGVDPRTAFDEDLLERAVLDALGDYVDEHAGRGPLRVVA